MSSEIDVLRLQLELMTAERDGLIDELKSSESARNKALKELKSKETERFMRNLENFKKTDPETAIHHKFKGMLESQAATLQCCGVITMRGMTSLMMVMGDVIQQMKKIDRL